jgi:hypothetical protein
VEMGDGYRVAEICLNGHVPTSAADQFPELREKYCSKCGETTIMACPTCSTPIRGYFFVEGVFGGPEFETPAHCHNCGKAFPWTERKIAGAVELVEVGADLSAIELQQFRNDLTEASKDTPKTQVASLRIKKILLKVGSSVADGVRTIIVDVLSEAAKKVILGK